MASVSTLMVGFSRKVQSLWEEYASAEAVGQISSLQNELNALK